MVRHRIMRILFAIAVAVALLAPPSANAGCRVMWYYECEWGTEECDPCLATARIYFCDDGWHYDVRYCCYCT
jgi:hypothetical protein